VNKTTEKSRLRVIYIVGAGRSGSTVLGIVLGNHPGISSIGELINLPQSGFINNEHDSSGKPCNEVPFWNKVKEIWMNKAEISDVSSYVSLQNRFSKGKIMPWLRLLLERYRPSKKFKCYSAQTMALFEAIMEVSGSSIIIDSSKSPMRAFALSQILDIELVLIHLVRDGRGVAYSLSNAYKKDVAKGIQTDLKPKSIWRTALFWIITNLQSEWVSRQVGARRFMLLRYEDFIQKPREVLFRIGALTGINFSSLADTLDAGGAMVVRHTIAGNRVRMKKEIRIRLDETWKAKFTLKQRMLFWNIAGWLMRRYSYDKD